MTANNEQLAFRFVELLADKAMRNGQAVPRCMDPCRPPGGASTRRPSRRSWKGLAIA